MVFNKYQVIKNAISYELANFIFNYFLKYIFHEFEAFINLLKASLARPLSID